VTATQLSQLTGTTVTAVSAPTVSAANPGDAASDEDGSIVMIAAAAGGVVFIIIVVGGIFALRGKKAPEPLPPKSVQQQVVAQSQVRRHQLPMTSEFFRLLPTASDGFRLLSAASDGRTPP